MTEPQTPIRQGLHWLAKNWQFAGIVALVATLVAVLALRDPSQAPDGYDATQACRYFVKERLKAPSTAEFSGESQSGSAPRWTVSGSVDAENSFGAKIRMSYTCTVSLDGSDFVLESLTGL